MLVLVMMASTLCKQLADTTWSALTLGAVFCWVLVGCQPQDAGPAGGAIAMFVPVQDQAGLLFNHVHGGSGRKYMIETMGSGGGFLDYNNDGWLDIYLVQSGPLPGFPDQTPLPNKLYRNNGDGTFTDVTEQAGVGDTGYGMGCAFGDIDNDGFIVNQITTISQPPR